MNRFYKHSMLWSLGGLLLSLSAQAQVKVGDNPTTLAPNTTFQVEKGGNSMVVSNSGMVGIGTTVPTRTLHVESVVTGFTGANEIMSISRVGWSGVHTRVVHNGGEYPYYLSSRARGTVASPAYSQSGDILMSIIGRDGVNTYDFSGSSIYAAATQNMGLNARGSNLVFNTTPNDGTSAVNRMTIDQNGFVGLGTSTPREALSFGNDFHLHNGGWKAIYSNMSYVVSGSGGLYQKSSPRRGSFMAIANTSVDGYGEGSIVFATETAVTPVGTGGTATLPLAMYIDGPTGNVGINTSATQKLSVGGSVLASAYNTPSDRRFKRDIQTLSGSLGWVKLLRGVSYTHTDEAINGRGLAKGSQIGFIAQELETLFPEIVTTAPDGTKSVDYGRLTPVLVEAIKEQQAQIDALTLQAGKVTALETEVASIKALLQAGATTPTTTTGQGK